MESRKHKKKSTARLSEGSELPVDYTTLVKDIYETNFADGLKRLQKLNSKKSQFIARGMIWADEIVMVISLLTEKKISATTVYCSIDFDPKASTPTAQDLLAVAVDVIGSFFEKYFDETEPKLLEALDSESLSALEDAPAEWTMVEFDKRQVWIKVDKTNPALDKMTDDWLAQNDPQFKESLLAEEEEHEESTKELFVTGKDKKTGGKGSSNLH